MRLGQDEQARKALIKAAKLSPGDRVVRATELRWAGAPPARAARPRQRILPAAAQVRAALQAVEDEETLKAEARKKVFGGLFGSSDGGGGEGGDSSGGGAGRGGESVSRGSAGAGGEKNADSGVATAASTTQQGGWGESLLSWWRRGR